MGFVMGSAQRRRRPADLVATDYPSAVIFVRRARCDAGRLKRKRGGGARRFSCATSDAMTARRLHDAPHIDRLSRTRFRARLRRCREIDVAANVSSSN